MKIPRFFSKEMKGWPTTDANLILVFEILLMSAFLIMNASDSILHSINSPHYTTAFSNPISQFIVPLISGMPESSLIFLERACWWFHIVGILAFLNYLVVSKHLHIILAFPNTFYSNLDPQGKLINMESVTNEVKMMLDPNNDPYAVAEETTTPDRFGAKDIQDLSWVQLMNAYSCTECGRCTSQCPANQTANYYPQEKS